MAKRRTLSYRNTAILSVAGGSIALAAAIAEPFITQSDVDLGVLGTLLAAVAIVAWFLGAAAGLLALSTEYKKMAIAGLVMCAAAILIFLIVPTVFGG